MKLIGSPVHREISFGVGGITLHSSTEIKHGLVAFTAARPGSDDNIFREILVTDEEAGIGPET